MAARKSKKEAEPAPAEERLQGFIDKFLPERAAAIRFAYARMLERWPAANVLVYDNYNFFVLGFGPSERASEAIFSLACQAKRVALCFLYGARLPKKLDPHGLLKGSGNQVRSLRLEPIERIDAPEVVALQQAANAHAKVPIPKQGKGALIIKSVSTKQRPRRPAGR